MDAVILVNLFIDSLRLFAIYKSKSPQKVLKAFHFSDSGGIQTPNLLIRSQVLYSVKLRSH